jgi:hypothetical protein
MHRSVSISLRFNFRSVDCEPSSLISRGEPQGSPRGCLEWKAPNHPCCCFRRYHMHHRSLLAQYTSDAADRIRGGTSPQKTTHLGDVADMIQGMIAPKPLGQFFQCTRHKLRRVMLGARLHSLSCPLVKQPSTAKASPILNLSFVFVSD